MGLFDFVCLLLPTQYLLTLLFPTQYLFACYFPVLISLPIISNAIFIYLLLSSHHLITYYFRGSICSLNIHESIFFCPIISESVFVYLLFPTRHFSTGCVRTGNWKSGYLLYPTRLFESHRKTLFQGFTCNPNGVVPAISGNLHMAVILFQLFREFSERNQNKNVYFYF